MQTKEDLEQINKDALKHREVIIALQGILGSKDGRLFIKYLLESFDVGILPEFGLIGEQLMDRLGFLRAGNSVFKIAAEANPDITGQLIAQIEKERYADLYNETR